MPYGPYPQKSLPKQDVETLMLLASRWNYAHNSMEPWSKTAKKCVDYFEGRQWTEEAKAAMEAQGRPALTFNMINKFVRLVLGYHRNTRTDEVYLPNHENGGDQAIAEVISKVVKTLNEANQVPWKDAEVFADGIMTGRGYWDHRLDFSENDFGEIRVKSVDPFTIYPDPEADEYDLNSGGFIFRRRWITADEVEYVYGKRARELIAPIASYGTTAGPLTSFYNDMPHEAPISRFGMVEDADIPYWMKYVEQIGDINDPFRKTVLMLDCQYWQRVKARLLVDLETGERREIPDHWDNNKIQKVIWYGQQVGNPLTVEQRTIKKVRWTHVIGDVIVYDNWSPYDTFTITGYFPWFRRGVARGMVEDLIAPQDEKNKRRSAEIEIVSRASNGGWVVEKGALDNEQQANIRQFGSAPGVIIEPNANMMDRVKRLDASPPPTAMERLEQKGADDMHSISGVNESALGELDTVQSGRAIEARQRQAVIGLQIYMDNFSRSKELCGRKKLELIQSHYTEERVFRVSGENDTITQIVVNQAVPGPNGGPLTKLNDITLGKYVVSIDETPLAETFNAAQFAELMELLGNMGPVGEMLVAAAPDDIIRMSSLPNKEIFAQKLLQYMQAQQQAAQQQAQLDQMDAIAGGAQ